MAREPSTPRVHKTFKLYIGGAFPRSESGRTLPLADPRGRSARPLAQIARASRKDVRNAAQAARKSFQAWSGATAVLRGQIMHRIAEMVDRRRTEFECLLHDYAGLTKTQAGTEVESSINRLIWYAGWCDKLAQVLGTVNPVAGPWFNFSMPEACGVIAVLPPSRPALLGLVSLLAPVLVPGNTAVAIVPIEAAPVAITFAEVLATSDVPAGVANILTGTRAELLEHVATHREFDGSFLVSSDAAETELVEAEAADHVKRQRTVPDAAPAWWRRSDAQDPRWLQSFLEIKTAWHTMGR